MTQPDMTGQALTVLGPVDPAALGQTLMHEHLFSDMRRPAHARRPDEDTPAAAEPLTLKNLSAVRNGAANADNDVIDGEDLVVAEALAFSRAGGGTIVDVTGDAGTGREPRRLASVSKRTGLHVVMGTAFYTPTFHPVDMDDRSVEDLAATLIADIIEGVDGTGICAGIIGEIGAEIEPLTPNEWKSIRAGAVASRRTGAPMSFHMGGQGAEKLAVLDVCADEGVAPENIVMGHANPLAVDLELGRAVLGRGVFVEIDFLAATGSPWGHLFLPRDRRMIDGIAALVREGYAGQLLLGHDICQKIQLKAFGGAGYDYIHRHFLPELRAAGVGEAAITAMMVENPARALAFAAPQPS